MSDFQKREYLERSQRQSAEECRIQFTTFASSKARRIIGSRPSLPLGFPGRARETVTLRL